MVAYPAYQTPRVLPGAPIPPRSLQTPERQSSSTPTSRPQHVSDFPSQATRSLRSASSTRRAIPPQTSLGIGIKDCGDDGESMEFYGHFNACRSSARVNLYLFSLFSAFRFLRIELETVDDPLETSCPSYVETGHPLSVETSLSAESDRWIGEARGGARVPPLHARNLRGLPVLEAASVRSRIPARGARPPCTLERHCPRREGGA